MAEPVTFEEAREEFTEEREEEGEEPFWAGESDVIPEDADLEERLEHLESIITASPPGLATRRGVAPSDPAEQVSSPLRQTLVDVTVPTDELASQLEEAESQTDFLQSIAASNVNIAETLTVASETLIETLDATFDIARFLSPFVNVTVSGTNDIEDADTAELVVPESDTIDIVTRVLFIKASENNGEPIAIGDDDTEPTNGWILNPNESLILNINLIEEVLYMASSEAGQTVELLGLE